MNHTDREILRVALPAIITNITVPLLGLVDTAIVGHLGSASYIGAIAVGSMMFNLIYWVFGFLRMGTSGLTAQAYGRGDWQDSIRIRRRAARQALLIALALIVLQWPLRWLMLWFIDPTPDVRPLAETYFNIVIWGAPAVLGLYSLTGWFIGMQNTRTPMRISISQNIVNIVVSLLLVYVLGMKITGIALGTVIAQYVGLAMALKAPLPTSPEGEELILKASPRGGLEGALNRDIFLRTLCLVAVNLYFTAAGARQGAVVLAVNTLLMQLYLLFSYILDGFAYAGEALGGRFWGAGDRQAVSDVVRRLFGWGGAMVVLFTLVYVIGGLPFLRLLTDEPQVVEAARPYVFWAYLIPAAGVAAFVWDGLFIGFTATRGMLWSSVLAAAVFFATAEGLVPQWGNHGLWMAMIVYLLVRGWVQTFIYHWRKPLS
ncbi:MAG: MATE family efflux transporter [Prevotella sp.]|nr:MATE family efflux transporter [Prevotella sp.]